MKNSVRPRSLLLCTLLLTTQQTHPVNFYTWLLFPFSSVSLTSYIKKHPIYTIFILSLATFGIITAKNKLSGKASKDNQQTADKQSSNNENDSPTDPPTTENTPEIHDDTHHDQNNTEQPKEIITYPEDGPRQENQVTPIVPAQVFEEIKEQPIQVIIKNNEPFRTADLIQLLPDIRKIIFCRYLNFPDPELIQNIKTSKDIKRVLLALKRLVNIYLITDTQEEAEAILKNGFIGVKFFHYPDDSQAQYWHKVKPGIERLTDCNTNNHMGYRIAMKVDPKNTFVNNRLFDPNAGFSKDACAKKYNKSKVLLRNVIKNKKMVGFLELMSSTITQLTQSSKKQSKQNKELEEQNKKLKQELEEESRENERLKREIRNCSSNNHLYYSPYTSVSTILNTSPSGYGHSRYSHFPRATILNTASPVNFGKFKEVTFEEFKNNTQPQPSRINWGQDAYTSQPVRLKKSSFSVKGMYMPEMPVNGDTIQPERFITD